VAPKLYLAAGISGADPAQGRDAVLGEHRGHQQGLQRPPIFEFSDLGVVGDLNKIVPKLADAIKGEEGA
jgi:electron transfer flavoprotein alpha subunit